MIRSFDDHADNAECDDDDDDSTINDLISQLSLDQKLKLLSGSGLWTISGTANLHKITVSDGPHGVRKPLSDLTLQQAHPATCFPAGCAVACSWNVETLWKMGQGLALECQLLGISVLLGPAMNLKRHMGGGRNLEYFAEDPFLTGTLAAAYVHGVQHSKQVGACLKHYAVNNQESHRFVVNAVVDERTLRELYLKSFELALEAEPAMVMGAYNQVNGTYCCEHEWLLTQVLREEFNYRGVCVTDWGATNDRVRALTAGMDLEMPGNQGVFQRQLQQACHKDPFLATHVNASVRRILNLLRRYPAPASTSNDEDESVEEQRRQDIWNANHELAYEIALDSVVLLKNDHGLLPLSSGEKIAVIGEFAKASRYQGMGSSKCTPTRVDHAWEAIQQYTTHVEYAPGYQATSGDDLPIRHDLLEQAKQVAAEGDVVVLFLGLPEIWESEGFDRETLKLPKQQVALLEIITALQHNKVVVILSNGGAVELPDCITKVSAILEGYLLGQAGGRAIVDLLFGKTSPSGKLPESLPTMASQLPCHGYFPGTRDRVEYREGLNVGYRYLNTVSSLESSRARFPFGHGLSYAEFEYSQLHVTVPMDDPTTKQVRIRFQLKNIGKVTAKEVSQCYVAPLDASVYRPAHELKAFTKILINPGESKEVTFDLSQDAFAFYDIGYQTWTVELGRYEIQVGASSRDIRLQRVITFQTGVPASILAKESYSSVNGMSTDDNAFAQRFGPKSSIVLDSIRQSKEPNHHASKSVDRNSLLKEVAASSILGKGLFWLVFKIGCREIQPGPTEAAEVRMVRANVENLPLRTIILFSGGALSMEFMDGLIALMNGNLLGAIAKFGETIWNGIRGIFGRR